MKKLTILISILLSPSSIIFGQSKLQKGNFYVRVHTEDCFQIDDSDCLGNHRDVTIDEYSFWKEEGEHSFIYLQNLYIGEYENGECNLDKTHSSQSTINYKLIPYENNIAFDTTSYWERKCTVSLNWYYCENEKPFLGYRNKIPMLYAPHLFIALREDFYWNLKFKNGQTIQIKNKPSIHFELLQDLSSAEVISSTLKSEVFINNIKLTISK